MATPTSPLRLILASIAGLVVGVVLGAAGAMVTQSPHGFVGGFFLGVIGTVVAIMGRPSLPTDDSPPVPEPSPLTALQDEADDEPDPDGDDDPDAAPRKKQVFGPRLEAAYQRVRSAVASDPPKSDARLFVLLFTLIYLADALRTRSSLDSVLVVVGVLLAHELGHFVGMRWFGYRDVRVFFIPGFGAATTGRPEGAARWKEGVVLLLGPVPGLLVGTALLWQRPLDPALDYVALTLVLINALNLLPIGGLDGGKLIQLVLFSRDRRFELPFLVCANVGMLALAWTLKSVPLAFFGVVGVVLSRTQVKVGRLADEVRARHGVLGPLASVSDGAMRDLFLAARSSLPPATTATVGSVTTVVRQLHEAARSEPVTPGQGAALLAAYVVAMGVAVTTVITVFVPR